MFAYNCPIASGVVTDSTDVATTAVESTINSLVVSNTCSKSDTTVTLVVGVLESNAVFNFPVAVTDVTDAALVTSLAKMVVSPTIKSSVSTKLCPTSEVICKTVVAPLCVTPLALTTTGVPLSSIVKSVEFTNMVPDAHRTTTEVCSPLIANFIVPTEPGVVTDVTDIVFTTVVASIIKGLVVLNT